jgi:hypothetical protein
MQSWYFDETLFIENIVNKFWSYILFCMWERFIPWETNELLLDSTQIQADTNSHYVWRTMLRASRNAPYNSLLPLNKYFLSTCCGKVMIPGTKITVMNKTQILLPQTTYIVGWWEWGRQFEKDSIVVSSFFLFGGTGIWNQGFELARQVL